MNTIAVTTRTGQAGSPLQENVSRLLDAGFERLVLPRGFDDHDWSALSGHLRPGVVAAAHLFAPLRRRAHQGAPTPPRVGSIDSDERREAGKLARRCVEFLDSNGIDVVIVPTVALEEPTRTDVLALAAPRTPAAAWERLDARRDASELAARQRDSYLATLHVLLESAARYGRRVAIVPGTLPHELPCAAEVTLCRREFAGAPLELFPDMVRCEWPRLARGVDSTIEATVAGDDEQGAAASITGVLVHDGDLARDSLPLRAGTVDLKRWARFASRGGEVSLRHPRLWILDLDESVDVEAVDACRAELERLFAGESGGGGSPKAFTNPFLDSRLTDLV